MGIRYECAYCGKDLPEAISPCCGQTGHTVTLDLHQLRSDAIALQQKHLGLLASISTKTNTDLEKGFTRFLWEIDRAIHVCDQSGGYLK